MSAESASDRQRQWELVVRHSFGISDGASDQDAWNEVTKCFEEKLRENGWQETPRGIAEPMVNALVALGADGELDDYFAPAALSPPETAAFTTRDPAHRLLDKGLGSVDPEHLAFGVMFEYPDEVIATAQQVLDQVGHYMREQQSGHD
jgi:hypothetical protein